MYVDKLIKLENLSRKHARDIFSIIDTQRGYLGAWLPFITYTKNINDTYEFIDFSLSQPGSTVYAILYENDFAGLIGFKDYDNVNNKIEIGYWLSENMQGKGIMSKAINALLNHAFTNMRINRVQLKIVAENEKSKRVALNAGFIPEGIERQGEMFPDGSYKNLQIYSMLKSEFTRSKASNN